MQSFSSDHRFLVIPTSEDAVSGVGDLSDPERQTADQVAEYLGEHPLNAVVLVGSDDDIFGEQTFDPPLFVARVADGVTYYASLHPCTEPDDVCVEGVDVETALREVSIEYYE
jgi:hypothetical protein